MSLRSHHCPSFHYRTWELHTIIMMPEATRDYHPRALLQGPWRQRSSYLEAISARIGNISSAIHFFVSVADCSIQETSPLISSRGSFSSFPQLCSSHIRVLGYGTTFHRLFPSYLPTFSISASHHLCMRLLSIPASCHETSTRCLNSPWPMIHWQSVRPPTIGSWSN